MAISLTPQSPNRRSPTLSGVLSTALPAGRIGADWQELVARIGFIAGGAFILNVAMQTWQLGQIGTHHEVVWMIFGQYALALALLVAGVLNASRMQRAAPLIAVAIVLAMLAWFYVKIEINLTIYGTDNAAFSHVAAEKLLDGKDPYSIRDRTVIENAAERFGVPVTFVTSTTDGRTLDNLMSWPAGSILAVAPALWLGVNDVRWVVVAFEIAVLVLLWLRAPPSLRPLVMLPLAVDPDLFLQFTAGGVMDFIWVLPVLGSAIALYSGRLGWAALLYGIAAGTKQQPWLLAPFLLIWVWKVRRESDYPARLRAVTEFAAIGSAGFLALNVWFMTWDFQGWLRAVLLPFREQLVPFGSGISLLTQTGLADLPKDFYTAATFGVWGVLLLAYALYFRTLKHAIWLAPAIIMWFGYRSLQNYFVFWTPIAFVGLMAWWEEQQRDQRAVHQG